MKTGHKRLGASILLSVVAHVALYGGGLVWLAWQRDAQYMEIDLQSSSLLLRPKGLEASAPRPVQEPWLLSIGKISPRPQPLSSTAAQHADSDSAVCPPPCPSSSSDWMPAAAASRRPEWSEGLIGEDDYPLDMRKANIEGLVVAEVLIDAMGQVRKVDISQSQNSSFSQVVMQKLLASRFHPALDREGNPVAVRVRLPIRFELR